METFWNYYAEAIRYLLNHSDEKFWQTYRSIKLDKLRKNFFKTFGRLLDNNTNDIIRMSEKMFDEKLINDFGIYLSEKMRAEMLAEIVYCLSKFDHALEFVLEQWADGRKSCEERKVLNTNADVTAVQLVRRTVCSWERRSRGKQHYQRLDNYLHNLMYINLSAMEDFEIRHYAANHDFLKRAAKRGRLIFGVSPVSMKIPLEIEDRQTDDERRFGVKNSEEIADKLLNVLKSSKEIGVDILIFPEMLGTEADLETIKVFLGEEWLKVEDGMKYPDMIVFPTIWKEQRNTAVVLDERGKELFRQQKQHPFFMPDVSGDSKEDIIPDRKIHLLHCEGIGRVVIMICMDFLQKRYVEMVLEQLKPTILIVPSFSTGSHDFSNMVGQCKAQDCSVFWVNTCAAIRFADNKKENFEYIAITAVHGRKGMDSDEKAKQYREEECMAGECRESCLFLQKIKYEKQLKI